MSGAVRFAGYAALFDKVDRGGDVVAPGAFSESLSRRPAVPLLWQHDPARPIGLVELAEEDRRGLRVVARLTAPGAAAYPGTGLSFGYRVCASDGTRPRRLIALDLVEISLVAFPMQPLARVHLVLPATPNRQ